MRISGSQEVAAGWTVHLSITGDAVDAKWARGRSIHGIDELHAVLSALKIARAILTSDPACGGRLCQDGSTPEDGLGLPAAW